MTRALSSVGTGTAALALRAAAVAGLAVDTAVHLELAPRHDALGTQLTQGALFRVEAALAVAAALFLLASGTRAAWRCAGLIALAGTLAILVTRYLQLPAVGPVPAMYDPSWSTAKITVMVSTLLTATAWLLHEARSPSHAQRDRQVGASPSPSSAASDAA